MECREVGVMEMVGMKGYVREMVECGWRKGRGVREMVEWD